MKKLMMVLGALCLVLCAGVAQAGANAVPSKHVDIGTVGSDRVLHGGCVYEVTRNTTFIGANAGESGLIVAPGETVYIHINKGVTLTCAGSAGASAAPGEAGSMPKSAENGIKEWHENGVYWREIKFATARAGDGGSGGQGGGAGIEVPSDSSLFVYGDGKLVANGGKGGDGSSGGAGAQGAYHILTWLFRAEYNAYGEWGYVLYPGWGSRLVQADLNVMNAGDGPVGVDPDAFIYDASCKGYAFAQPASGGGGGGGAGGGGAAIGSRGADGSQGGSGGAVSSTFADSQGAPLLAVAGKFGGPVSPAAKCGSVSIGLSSSGSCELQPGQGGDSVTGEQVKIDREWIPFDAYNESGELVCGYFKILFENGQAGGRGGQGGSGAQIGLGGTGGQGGEGGYGGGVAGYVAQGEVPEGWVEAKAGEGGMVGASGKSQAEGKIPVLVRDPAGNVSCYQTLTEAVNSIAENPDAYYGSTVTVIGDVTEESAKVPSGTTVIVENKDCFREPVPNDLRQSYYLYPVPCDTNGDSRTYHYTFNTNLVVPVVSKFELLDGTMARITVANVCKDLYYRVLRSTTLRDFKPEPGSEKTRAGSDGTIILCGPAPGSKNFYCIGVTDDPRKDNR